MNEIFLDTSFAIAIVSRKDAFHPRSRRLAQKIKANKNHIITTQAVLLEIGNALAKLPHREACVNFIQGLENDPNTSIVPFSNELYEKAFDLFRHRTDKEWGLVDCFSFVVMREHGIDDALTTDDHFVQAGFRALLRED